MRFRPSPLGKVIIFSTLFQLFLILGIVYASAHSIYTGIYANGTLTPDRQNESTCCGDYDCEPLEAGQIEVRDGIVAMWSKRHGLWVEVSEARVTWGDIVTDKSNAAGHWCGRAKYDHEAVTDFQPDAKWHTYCAFVRPGGV